MRSGLWLWLLVETGGSWRRRATILDGRSALTPKGDAPNLLSCPFSRPSHLAHSQIASVILRLLTSITTVFNTCLRTPTSQLSISPPSFDLASPGRTRAFSYRANSTQRVHTLHCNSSVPTSKSVVSHLGHLQMSIPVDVNTIHVFLASETAVKTLVGKRKREGLVPWG